MDRFTEDITTQELNPSVWFDNVSRTVDDNTSKQVNSSERNYYEDEDTPEGFNPVIYCSIMAVMTALGVVGNLLIIVIFSIKRNRKKSFSVYLRALAVSDSLFLLNTLTDDIITRLFDGDILYGNRDICSAYLLWNMFWDHFSAGLLVLVALDRYIAVAYPLKRAFICSYKRAIYITLGITLWCICANLYETIWNEVETKSRNDDVDGKYICPVMDSLEYDVIITIHRLIFIFIIPFCVVLVFNLRVIHLIKTSLRAKQNPNSVSLIRATLPVISITLSSVFFLLPVLIVEVVEFIIRWIDIPSEHQANIDIAWSVANAVGLLNHGTNFYILVFFNKNYRDTLKKACSCKKVTRQDIYLTDMATKSTSMATDST